MLLEERFVMWGLCFRLLQRNSSSFCKFLLFELIFIDPRSLGGLIFVE